MIINSNINAHTSTDQLKKYGDKPNQISTYELMIMGWNPNYSKNFVKAG